MLEDLRKQFNKLCRPSQFYLFVSLLSILIIGLQNLTNPNKYCVGNYQCDIQFPNLLIFISKLIYVFVWAVIFDSLCKNGYTNLAWAIILVPVVLMFLMITVFMVTNSY